MKKTLSLVLTVLMVVSLLCFGANAAEGTAITDAAGFAAMTADGTYYLDADIAIDATYPDQFKGVLDGNGHTVTISVPMFANLAGTIKNLTIEGDVLITTASTDGAAVAQTVKNATVVFENVINKANVTCEYRAGAFVAEEKGGQDSTSSITFINCENQGTIIGYDKIGGFVGYANGSMTLTGCKNSGEVLKGADETKAVMAGGFVGNFGGSYAFKEERFLTLTECTNDGAVTGTSHVGGMIGVTYGTLTTCDRCTNNGDITTDINCAAGMLGTGGKADNLSRCFFVRCTNNGTCTNNGLTNSGTASAAGMCGYIYGSGANGVGNFRYCINTGKMVGYVPNDGNNDTAQYMFVSQFMGYTNNAKTTYESCCGVGELDGKCKVLNGLSSADPNAYIVNNVILADGTEYFSYATAESNAAHIVTLADYMSAHAGAITISSTIPEYPAEDPTEAPTAEPTAAPTEAPTKAEDKPTEAPTQAQDQPTEPAATNAPETKAAEEKKGCKSVVSVGVVLVAIVGCAVVSKKKF